jgi:DNA invertase Pin-like site-specific DNA recombinase
MATRRASKGDTSKAIGYLRVSKAEGQELGPQAQRAQIERWASANGVTVVAWFEDHLTGATEVDGRPALIEALAAVRACRVGILAVAKRDRIARDVFVAATIERAAEAAGARVMTADGVGNGDDAGSAFMRQIQDAAAAYERAMIKARTKAALAVKKAKGERVGEVPFGFRVADDGVTLAEDEGEQGVIRTVREAASRGLSQRAIVAELCAAGVVARSGKALGKTQIARILSRAA